MTAQSTALATTDSQLSKFGEMSVQTIVDRKHKLSEVMEQVMQDGVHYGLIPGCGEKPSLFKAGAEVLATVFGLAPTFAIVETQLPGGHREYRITCTLTHIASGANLGEGVGACSTMESKYRWRGGARLCPKCSKPAIIKGKAEYGGGWVCFTRKNGCGAKWKDGAKEIEDQSEARTENPDPADQYNTVLKMAKKRAQVDCTLTAVGASDVLTQDIEDLPPASVVGRHVDATDAEFTDQPSADSSSKTTAAPGTTPPLTREDRQAALALDLILEIEKANTPDEVAALAPRFGDLPKGSKARASAFTVYQKRLADVTPAKATKKG